MSRQRAIANLFSPNGILNQSGGVPSLRADAVTSAYGDSGVRSYLGGNLDTHILPDMDAAYDIGNASYKIRDLYLSDNSLHVGENTISTDASKLLFNGEDVNAPPTTVLADIDALIAKTGMATGDMAYIQSNNKLFLYNGTGWYLVATVTNAQPTAISAVNSTYSLANDGTATVITAVSTDPEGFALTWSYAVTTGALGSTATVSQTDNVFTITPSTDEANAGEFSITFSVTDGATGVVSAISAFTLEFGWTVNAANMYYDNVSFDLSNQVTMPSGIAFNTTGTKMYIADVGSDFVYQYSLSTAFNLSTASYDNVSFSVLSQDQFSSGGLAFNTTGTKMYITGSDSDNIYQYSLSTGFDLSTASYDSVSFSVAFQDTSFSGLAFNLSGTRMFIVGNSTKSVYQYSLSTGFDLSTAAYNAVSLSIAASNGNANPRGLAFNQRGTRMYMTGYFENQVYQWDLSTGFDLSTAAIASGVSPTFAAQENIPLNMALSADGTKAYITGQNDVIYQYSTGL